MEEIELKKITDENYEKIEENKGENKEEVVEKKITNKKLYEHLKLQLFTNIKDKNDKIKLIIKTGNYDVAREKIPWYIILPNQRTKIAWDIIVCIFTIISLLYTPIDIAWDPQCFSDVSTFNTIQNAAIIIFMIDIGVNLITAILDEKNFYHHDIVYIIKVYAMSDMAWDLASCLPFQQIVTFDSQKDCFSSSIPISKMLKFLYFIRMIKISKLFLLMEKIFSRLTISIRLMKLAFTVLYLSHLLGSIYAGQSDTVAKVVYKNCYVQYQTSTDEFRSCMKDILKNNFGAIYYYSLQSGMLMILGNDFPTSNNIELFFFNITSILAVIVQANIFGNVSLLLSSMTLDVSPLLSEKIDIMTEYMSFMKFESFFVHQIKEYHMNIWFKQRNLMYDDNFLDDMSFALQKALLYKQWETTFFDDSKLFSFTSHEFIIDTITYFRPKIYMKNDIIITEGESNTEVFLSSANSLCKVYIGGQMVRDITQGEYFGEISTFLRSRRRSATILSFKDSDFLYIEGKTFEKLLRNHHKDYIEIKSRAVKTFIDNMKMYPPNLFSKLAPSSNMKDYLFRKCIHLEDDQEDFQFSNKVKRLIEKSEFERSLNEINMKLTRIKNNLLSLK